MEYVDERGEISNAEDWVRELITCRSTCQK